MDLKKISINTQFKLKNQALFFLFREDNLNQLEDNDKTRLLKIKKKFNTNFQLNVILVGSTYILLNFLIIKKIKSNFLNKFCDFSCICGVSYIIAHFLYQKNYKENKNEINFLNRKYSILIKNSIALNSNNLKDKNFKPIKIHSKYDYNIINFLFVLILRLFV
jgi:hypothetical protein